MTRSYRTVVVRTASVLSVSALGPFAYSITSKAKLLVILSDAASCYHLNAADGIDHRERSEGVGVGPKLG
jgi:hypothetical protein